MAATIQGFPGQKPYFPFFTIYLKAVAALEKLLKVSTSQ
jgi:hypothetical protein